MGYALQRNEPKWYVKTRDASYELRISSYELLATSLKLKNTTWNSKWRVQTHEVMTSN